MHSLLLINPLQNQYSIFKVFLFTIVHKVFTVQTFYMSCPKTQIVILQRIFLNHETECYTLVVTVEIVISLFLDTQQHG